MRINARVGNINQSSAGISRQLSSEAGCCADRIELTKCKGLDLTCMVDQLPNDWIFSCYFRCSFQFLSRTDTVRFVYDKQPTSNRLGSYEAAARPRGRYEAEL